MKKHINVKLITAIIILATFSFTGCNKETTSSEAEATSLPIKTYSSSISAVTNSEGEIVETNLTEAGTGTEAEIGIETGMGAGAGSINKEVEQEQLKDNELVLKIENNVLDDVPLNIVSLGGNNIDVANCSVVDFTEKTGLSYQLTGASTLDEKDYYFSGKGFAFAEETTMIFLEAFQDNKLIEEFKANEFGNYHVKGILSSKEFTKEGDESFALFCGGLHIGMTQKQVESIYGKGFESNGDTSKVFYKNTLATLIIEYEENSIGKIILFKND